MAAPWLRASVPASPSIKWQARSMAQRVEALYSCSGRALLLAAGATLGGQSQEGPDDLRKVSRLHRQEAADERFDHFDLVLVHSYRHPSILPPLSRRCGSGPTLIRGMGGYPKGTDFLTVMCWTARVGH